MITARRLRGKVVVVAGAADGVGRAAARLLARRGAKVMLIASATKADALADACARIREEEGAEAAFAVADVSRKEELEAAVQKTCALYGGFDAWVHAEADHLVRPLLEGSLDEERRLFDINFWGAVNGSEVALAHLRKNGGAVVNVGSIHSDRAFPLQGAQGATEHAFKAYTDALRMELARARIPVKVALVKAGWTDFPFPRRTPFYAPEVVARAVVACVARPRRDLVVGAIPALMTTLEKLTPWLADRLVQKWSLPKSAPRSRAEGQEDGWGPLRFPLHHSLYTAVKLHRLAIVLGIGAVAAALTFRRA